MSFEVATKDDSGLASAVKPQRLEEITRRYGGLRIAVVGDLCLDRYFEIDPKKQETSIETNLPVHNVTRVRGQAGAAGTISCAECSRRFRQFDSSSSFFCSSGRLTQRY